MTHPKKETLVTAPAPRYAELLGEIKQRIRNAQARAWMAVNAEHVPQAVAQAATPAGADGIPVAPMATQREKT